MENCVKIWGLWNNAWESEEYWCIEESEYVRNVMAKALKLHDCAFTQA